MKGELPDIDFTNNAAYFISFYENYCTKRPKNVQIEESTLTFILGKEGGEDISCPDIQLQKTLVLELTSSIENIVIIEHDVETQIPLE